MALPENTRKSDTHSAPASCPTPPSLEGLHPGAKKLGLILGIVVAGFMASLFFHYEVGAVKHQPYPLSTFLFRPNDQFSDFYISPQVAASLNPDESRRVENVGWGSSVILCYIWLRYTFFYPDYEFPLLVLYTCGFLGALFYFVRRTLLAISPDCLWAKILALTLCSYPVLISLDRSNQENFIFVLVASALLLLYDRRPRWAAALVGAAIATKPYGVIFLPIFVTDCRFKEVFIALGVAVGTTVLALVVMPGNPLETLATVHRSMGSYMDYYVIGNEGMYFNASLHGLAKTLIYWNHWFLDGADPKAVVAFMRQFSSIYFGFALVIFAAVLALMFAVRMPFWKKTALLACCINLLPYISGSYRMMYLFIPLLLFLAEKEVSREDRFFCVTFGLILIPKSYVHFLFDPVFRVFPFEVSDAQVLDPLSMTALLVGVAASVLQSRAPSDVALWIGEKLRPFRRRAAQAPANA